MAENWIYRIVGPPPGPDASPADRLRWMRKFYRLTFVAGIFGVILALATGMALFWFVAAVVLVTWLGGVSLITVQIRRADSALR